MLRFLPLVLIVTALAAVITYTPLKRTLVYGLGISGDTTSSCCEEVEVASSNGGFDESANLAIYDGEIIDYPKTSLVNAYQASLNNPNTQVLGTTNAAGEEKWIEVSLSEQKVRAWEGTKIAMEFLISSGKWYPTPKGTYYIWYKTRNQRMQGGNKALGTYYNLPNVPHNMFFYKGFALHGAYWHNSFGQPMSHGCVNEPLAQAAQIFDWAGPYLAPGINALKASNENPGTKVFVH
jgi:lipoprotein-anchoring transpeptidase ErfK/SrfK